jgi:glycosyltransferase involved in cell wall biosynthesis
MEDRKVKVVMVQRIFPHYRKEIFSSLNKGFEFTLLHSDNESGILQIEQGFGCKVKNVTLGAVSYLFLTLKLFKLKPEVIIHEFSISFVNLFVCFMYAKLTSCKIILWGHGYDRKSGFYPEIKLGDKIREYLIKECDALILYSDDVKDELLNKYKVDKFFVAKNSIQSQEKDSIFFDMERKGRLVIKNELGFSSVVNLCFVARLSPNKQVLKLCDIASYYIEKDISVMIHVVGDGECKNELQSLIEKRRLSKYFSLYGSIYDESKVAEIIYASDFVVIPAWLGLSINHALCYGTPVATLVNEPHPPEIAFAEDGVNSILAESCEEMVGRMIAKTISQEEYLLLRVQSRDFFVNNLGIEKMYSGFLNGIKHVVKHDM